MKFICDGTVLADAALTVSKACAVRTTTPILECIKLKAENDGLTLTAYDGEISIEKKILAEVMEEGELCVAGKTFSDFVNKISAFEVTVASDETGISIRYLDSETYMQTLSAADYPKFGGADGEKSNAFTMQESVLKDIIAKIVFCCATDESRPILKGALLETKEGKLYVTALDGVRMACASCDVEASDSDLKIVCPARTLTEISRMLDGEGTIELHAGKNMLSVEVQNTIVKSRLYAGEFVRKENVFPVDFTTRVVLKRSEVIESLERASVLIRNEKNNLVILDVKNGKLVISANSDMGKVEETISSELDGKELKIAMNGKFLLDAVKALEEEKILVSFNSPVSPFTLENLEDKRCQYLILPMRTRTVE